MTRMTRVVTKNISSCRLKATSNCNSVRTNAAMSAAGSQVMRCLTMTSSTMNLVNSGTTMLSSWMPIEAAVASARLRRCGVT